MRSLAICVLSYEGRQVLANCLDSIFRQVGDFDLDVVVTDNASTDGTADMVRRQFPQARLIRYEHNQPFTTCFNAMLATCQSDVVAVVNNDIVFSDPHTLATALQVVAAEPATGMVAFRSQRPDGTLDVIRKPERRLGDFVYDYTLLGPLLRGIRGTRPRRAYDQEADGTAEVLQDSSVFIRAAALNGPKLFDEDMKFYFTEDQIGVDFRRNGYQLRYSTARTVEHWHSATTKKLNRFYMRYIIYRDAMCYARKYVSGPATHLILASLTWLSFGVRVVYWRLAGI